MKDKIDCSSAQHEDQKTPFWRIASVTRGRCSDTEGLYLSVYADMCGNNYVPPKEQTCLFYL